MVMVGRVRLGPGIRRLWRRLRRPGALLAAVAALAGAGVAGPGVPVAFAGTVIIGSGSTWSANAMQQWIADIYRKGVPVQFTPNSSGQGRTDFGNYQNEFANSDIPFQGNDPLTNQPDSNNGRSFAYMPIVAGGTALMYHLEQGGKLISNLRLSGETITKIFTGVINMWNDPAITADMNGHALPAKKIQVVVESQGSGTTAQFTDWMAHQYGNLWGAYAGKNVPTSYYPLKAPNITAQNGDSQVAQTIKAPQYDGAIGYVQYSYAQHPPYPTVDVENAAHYFVSPNPYNVAVALTQASINTSNPNDLTTYLTQDLSRVYPYDDPRAYPLSSYSYSIIPTDPSDHLIDAARAQTFVDFARYFMCEGQNSMPDLGYSPLTINLVAQGFAQVKKYSHIDPNNVPSLDPTKCNNPTYYPQDPSKNRLAEIDPPPPSCAMAGQGPCGLANGTTGGAGGAGGARGAGGGTSGTGGGAGGAPGGGGANGGTGGAGAGGSAGSGAGTGAAANGPASGVDPETGQAYGAAGAGNGSVAGTPSQLAAFRPRGMDTVMGVLAAIELVLVLLVPTSVARAIDRLRARKNGKV